MSKWELWLPERNKTWTCDRPLLIYPGPVLIYPDFVDDRVTGGYNFKEWRKGFEFCPCPEARQHDFIFVHRIHADGTPVSFEQANRYFFHISHSSTNPIKRIASHWRHSILGMRIVEEHVWNQDGRPEPIPEEWRYLYGDTKEAELARAKEAWIITVDAHNRLIVKPPTLLACESELILVD